MDDENDDDDDYTLRSLQGSRRCAREIDDCFAVCAQSSVLKAGQQMQGGCKIAATALGFLRERYIRPTEFIERVVHNYSGQDFKSHFRLTRETVEELLKINHVLKVNEGVSGGNEPISVEKMTLVTLWYLANQESMRGISDR